MIIDDDEYDAAITFKTFLEEEEQKEGWYWLSKYVFNKDFDLLLITDAPINDTHFTIPFKIQKVLFIVDPFFSQIDEEGPLKQINRLYNNTHTKAIFDRGLVKIRSNHYWYWSRNIFMGLV